MDTHLNNPQVETASAANTQGADYWEETAGMYGQLFSKPKMVEKYLRRPPFRYLHAIFMATMDKTKYGQGLYQGDELEVDKLWPKGTKAPDQSEENREKQAAWLKKAITLAESMILSGETIDIDPKKILDGKDPEKTNIYLQMQYRAATSDVDSAPFVAKISGSHSESLGNQIDNGGTSNVRVGMSDNEKGSAVTETVPEDENIQKVRIKTNK